MDLLQTTHNRRSRVHQTALFFGTAAIAGILFNLLFFQLYNTRSSQIVHLDDSSTETQCPLPPAVTNVPKTSPLQWRPLEDKTLEELRDMVATTKGYYARDWSLGLGWNNMRYIIEASLLHAQLLNRTLVLPSFVYARSCEFEIHVCANFGRMVNRGDAIGSDEWRELPMERQMAWRLPIDIMLDIPHLRKFHPVILVSEYLKLQGLSVQKEWANGAWHVDEYHRGATRPSLFIIRNSDYDAFPMVRVDTYESPPPDRVKSVLALQFDEQLRKRLGRAKLTLPLDVAYSTLMAMQGPINGTNLALALEEAGWVPLNTWDGALGMDYVKWVINPRIDVAPRDRIRGFVEDFAHLTEDVILLKGEVHLGRKPGGMRFTTEEASRNFARMVLKEMRPPTPIASLASRLIKRIDTINEGRLWQAAHMRRGDFVTHGWVMEGTVHDHFERIKSRLKKGKEILEVLHVSELKPYDIPDVQVNEALHSRETPRDDDAIYIATDERDPAAIQYLRNNSVILFRDLLSLQDRREFGWPLLFTDVVALVEQVIMGVGAAYFYGHALSSVAGGVINTRASAGWDFQTALID
ncbi:hypothetical protein CPB86DRAFT_754331 [Serendipita vermifera]|nr:hypothetical protein CPB86DRAFT_754331 [Serendipita vermifera]